MIKHFDSKFIYHSDHFQKISDILSCMPEFREKRDSVDINHLFEIEQSEFIFEITKVIVSHNIEFYIKFHDFLKRNIISDKDSILYEFDKNERLWNQQLRILIIFSSKNFRAIMQLIHKNLDHYDKYIIFYITKQRYEIATDLS